MKTWNRQSALYLEEHEKTSFFYFFLKKEFDSRELNHLIESMEENIGDLLNSDENLIIGKLMDYPVIKPLHFEFLNKPFIRRFCEIVFPIGLIIYLIVLFRQKQINKDLVISRKVNENLVMEIENLNYGL
jgi:lipopolysaccharide export system permease protein